MPTSAEIHASKLSKEQEYLDGWQRARADLENLKKRNHEEFLRQQQTAKRHAIESFLPLADNFRSLVQHVPESLKDDSWVQGATHVARQFDQVLESYGISVINPTGGAFDPNLHEAIEEVNDESVKSGEITEVVLVGYKLGDTVLRPARVKVAA